VISESHKAATGHNTTEKSSSSETRSSSAAQSITLIHETRRLNAVSTKDGQWSLSWARKIHSTPFHPDNINFSILFPPATRSSKMSLSFSLSKKIQKKFYFLPCVLQSQPAHSLILDKLISMW